MKKVSFNNALWQKILAVDLTRVWQRLIVKDGYTAERADAAILGYRQYLYLVEVRGNISPTPDVDDAWHAHIMHLASYVRDCITVFGRIIYHTPNQISEADVAIALAGNFQPNQSVVKMANCMPDPPSGECSGSTNCQDGGGSGSARWEGFSDCKYLQGQSVNGQIHFTATVPADEYAGNPTTAFALADFEQLVEEVF